MYWAKDVLELFRLERRHSFQRLLELVMAQSGGMFEATRLARACEVSRPTITNYVSVLEATFVAHLLRPYAAGGSAEIVTAPKVVTDFRPTSHFVTRVTTRGVRLEDWEPQIQ